MGLGIIHVKTGKPGMKNGWYNSYKTKKQKTPKKKCLLTGEEISRIRQKKGINHFQLAEAMKVNVNTVIKWENGKISPTRAEKVIACLKSLN